MNYKEEIFSLLFERLNSCYNKLNYINNSVIDVCRKIIKCCIDNNKEDVTISITGENEILFYREINGELNNIIIDEDSDIEFMHIPKQRENTYNKLYTFGEYINIQELVSKL